MDPQPFCYSRPKLLYDHVGALSELIENLASLVMLQIEPDGSFIAVQRPVRRMTVDAVAGGWHCGKVSCLFGASPCGRAGFLDFDHIRSEVGEDHRAIRSRGEAGEIENSDSFKRHGHCVSSPP